MKYQLTKKGAFITVFVTLVLVVCSLFLMSNIKINYDLSTYLPEDSNTKQGLVILEENFANEAAIQLMLNQVTASDVIKLKTDLTNVSHVSSVVWLDDFVDLRVVPIEFVPKEIREQFYKDNHALIQITFDFDGYDIRLQDSIDEIKTILISKDFDLRGEVLTNIEARNVASGETFKILFIILPICLLILLIASKSYLEPIVILIALGVGISLNQGTNAFLPNVSYITMTMALALQLAMSLDYALFLIHRFYEHHEAGSSIKDAISSAFKESLRVISASALTTIAGFVALFFMDYKIGFDIGLVLSKGIFLSYLAVILVLPVLLFLFGNLIIKTKHRTFLPSFKPIGQMVYRLRKILPLVFLVLFLVVFIFSRNVTYLYGNQTSSHTKTNLELQDERITEVFGYYNPVVILVKNQSIEDEIELSSQLSELKGVTQVLSLVTSVDPAIDRSLIDPTIKDNFLSPDYSRFIIYTSIYRESDELYQFNESLKDVVKAVYDDFYFVGLSTSIYDIKTSVSNDQTFIILLSALSVLVVILILFKSFLIPILLVLVIEFAIFTNLFVLYVTDTPILFIGYLVVMSIQLGATIDYAVLIADRYQLERKHRTPKNAFLVSYHQSIPTVFVSMIILFSAGLVEGLFSDIESIQSIGLFLAKGTIISFLSVLFFTGPLLLLITEHSRKNKQST